MTLQNFRAETRAWLEENCPPGMRTPMPDNERVWGGKNPVFKHPESKLWFERMVERGWTAPAWPREFGGGGLSRQEADILTEEMRRLECRPPLFSFGLYMLGPLLLDIGTREQKERYLPPIVRGEIWWCQGYSEPGAGSDLASLQTRAEDQGDHYLVNGQKVWTSYAHHADWIFCLVRTDTSVKHAGISFLLFDMHSPGIEVRPIKLISGSSAFCETFFDNVKVPRDQLIGAVNGGWAIAKQLLAHERAMISQLGARGGQRLPPLEDLARKYLGDSDGRIHDPVLRDLLARQLINDRAFELTSKRATLGGDSAAGVAAMLKYYGTEQNKRKFELLMKFAGSAGLGWEGDGFDDIDLTLCRSWLRSKGNSIEGGTSEVQLNVIAKRVLGLPD
ncbi:MAG: acyl-CoA dehydrogenase family protein [Gammaproteobacteria bacterium]|nr:acyl-CoA dehydrogenase family protein [Gammaproteobacteria bacterium]